MQANDDFFVHRSGPVPRGDLSVSTFVKYIGPTPEAPESMGKGQDHGQDQGKPEQIRDDSLSKHV